MSNFYCIPNECARVVYRRYEAGGIRYRYPGEDWITIDGDSWNIEDRGIVCARQDIFGTFYAQVVIKTTTEEGDDTIFDATTAIGGTGLGGGSPSITFNREQIIVNGFVQRTLRNYVSSYDANRPTTRFASVNYQYTEYSQAFFNPDGSFRTSQRIDISNGVPEGFEDACAPQCQLTIFKDGEIVHQQTREECPEVEEQNVCRLSDIHEEIQVDKLPFLERVEVVDYGFFDFGLNEFTASIPDECLNIYVNNITAAFPPFNVVTPNLFDGQRFITQICSASGCPPPEFEVICDCDCQSCPDGTCAVECNGQICCYNENTGEAIASIPLDNYCEGI